MEKMGNDSKVGISRHGYSLLTSVLLRSSTWIPS